ncbi:MAG: hypothetical protein WAK55_00845 [Xanthobacteraceae bacterium]
MTTRLRFLINANRIEEVMPEGDEAPSTTAAALGLLKSLSDLLADPKKAAAQIGQFTDAANKANDAIAKAKTEQSNAHDARNALAAAQEAHTKKLADEKLAHEQQMSAREVLVVSKEKDADDKHRAAVRALDEANKLKSQLQARLDLVRQAAAE